MDRTKDSQSVFTCTIYGLQDRDQMDMDFLMGSSERPGPPGLNLQGSHTGTGHVGTSVLILRRLIAQS